MKKGYKLLIVGFLLVFCISVYFNITLASAEGTAAAPGSDQDPLVTKGYVDQQTGKQSQTVALLQTQVNTLAAEKSALADKVTAQEQLIATMQESIKALQDEVKALKAKAGQTPVVKDPGTTSPVTAGTAVVNTATLNMRATASTSAAIVAKLAKGDTLTLISKSGDWYKVKNAKGVTGWVLGTLITVKK